MSAIARSPKNGEISHSQMELDSPRRETAERTSSFSLDLLTQYSEEPRSPRRDSPSSVQTTRGSASEVVSLHNVSEEEVGSENVPPTIMAGKRKRVLHIDIPEEADGPTIQTFPVQEEVNFLEDGFTFAPLEHVTPTEEGTPAEIQTLFSSLALDTRPSKRYRPDTEFTLI